MTRTLRRDTSRAGARSHGRRVEVWRALAPEEQSSDAGALRKGSAPGQGVLDFVVVPHHGTTPLVKRTSTPQGPVWGPLQGPVRDLDKRRATAVGYTGGRTAAAGRRPCADAPPT